MPCRFPTRTSAPSSPDADVAEVEAARRLRGLDETFLHGPRGDVQVGDELSTEARWMRFGRDDMSIYREVYGYDGYVAGIRQIALAVLRDEELAASKTLPLMRLNIPLTEYRTVSKWKMAYVASLWDATRTAIIDAELRLFGWELHEYSWVLDGYVSRPKPWVVCVHDDGKAHSDWEEWLDIPMEFSTVCGGKAVIDFVTDEVKLVLRDPSTFGWIIRGRVETIKSVDNETGTVYRSGSCLLEAGAHVALR
ncbi:hypothetical protein HK405_010570 [Cladochytrium tenue]|nr:hypothetical protein HK405_010570 [Cladochytrium tenue]